VSGAAGDGTTRGNCAENQYCEGTSASGGCVGPFEYQILDTKPACIENCPTDTAIVSAKECKTAIESLGATFKKEVSMQTNRPIGCFKGTNNDKKGYFNTLTDDSGQTLGWCGVTPVCRQITCTDGIKNQDEEGVDCGGSCTNTC